MPDRQNIASGARWEDIVGYSRAVRVGDRIVTAGTLGIGPDGTVVAPGDAYAQARRALEIIEVALAEAGARMTDVIRTRMYVTDMAFQSDVGRAHHEVFSTVRPAATMVGVSGLAAPGAVVEIEAEAIAGTRREEPGTE